MHAIHCSQGKNQYRAEGTIHIGGWCQPDNDGIQIEAKPYVDPSTYANVLSWTHHQGNVIQYGEHNHMETKEKEKKR